MGNMHEVRITSGQLGRFGFGWWFALRRCVWRWPLSQPGWAVSGQSIRVQTAKAMEHKSGILDGTRVARKWCETAYEYLWRPQHVCNGGRCHRQADHLVTPVTLVTLVTLQYIISSFMGERVEVHALRCEQEAASGAVYGERGPAVWPSVSCSPRALQSSSDSKDRRARVWQSRGRSGTGKSKDRRRHTVGVSHSLTVSLIHYVARTM
jgi:hypothetical protein